MCHFSPQKTPVYESQLARAFHFFSVAMIPKFRQNKKHWDLVVIISFFQGLCMWTWWVKCYFQGAQVGLVLITIISYFLVVQVDPMGLGILTSVLLV